MPAPREEDDALEVSEVEVHGGYFTSSAAVGRRPYGAVVDPCEALRGFFSRGERDALEGLSGTTRGSPSSDQAGPSVYVSDPRGDRREAHGDDRVLAYAPEDFDAVGELGHRLEGGRFEAIALEAAREFEEVDLAPEMRPARSRAGEREEPERKLRARESWATADGARRPCATVCALEECADARGMACSSGGEQNEEVECRPRSSARRR